MQYKITHYESYDNWEQRCKWSVAECSVTYRCHDVEWTKRRRRIGGILRRFVVRVCSSVRRDQSRDKRALYDTDLNVLSVGGFCWIEASSALSDKHILCFLICMNKYPIFENKRPTWCHLLFYFNSYTLNMFRVLIYPSSGAYDYSVELPHWWCVLSSMCVGVSVWSG